MASPSKPTDDRSSTTGSGGGSDPSSPVVPEYGGHRPSREETRRATLANLAETISSMEGAVGLDGARLPAPQFCWDGERVNIQGAPPGTGARCRWAARP